MKSKILKKAISLVLSFLILSAVIPVNSIADVFDDLTLKASAYTSTQYDPNSNDSLLQAYIDQQLGLVTTSKKSLPNSSSFVEMSPAENAIYNALTQKIKQVANGTLKSTVFKLSQSELGEPFTNYYKINVDGVLDAMGGVDISKLLNILLNSLPYDLYWYNKSVENSFSFSYSMSGNSNGYCISSVTITMLVSNDYGTGTAVNDKPARVGQAITQINQIIDENANKTDIEKLTAYKEKICELVSYNYAAASESWTGGYGDPWQLIYVFDDAKEGEQNETKVVCEGYSKAFKYLCDLSQFSDNNIKCLLVSGKMNGGDHMWNIVRFSDNLNYLVDVTNCDGENSVGFPDKLFLVNNFTQKNGDYEYTFAGINNSQITYRYDDDTINYYNKDEIVFADSHTITVTNNPNGTVSPDKNTAKKGQTVNLTVTPQSDYEIDNIKINDEKINPVNGSYSFVMPDNDVTITSEFSPKICLGSSLSLEGNIGVLFCLNSNFINVGDKVTFTYSVTKNNTPTTKTQEVSVKSDYKMIESVNNTSYEYYAVPCKINASEMTSEITAKVTHQGKEYLATMSVLSYAKQIMSDEYKSAYESEGYQDYDKLYDFVVKMLDYGAKSQLKFDTNLDSLANANLTSYTMESIEVSEMVSKTNSNTAPDMVKNLSNYGLSYEGTSLLYLSDTTLRHYYKIVDNTKFNAVKDSLNYKTKNDDMIYFDFANIAPNELGEKKILTIGNDKYSFSALDYLQTVLSVYNNHEGLTPKDADLAIATYHYYCAAYVYNPI